MRDPLKFKEGAKTLQRATICRGRTTRNTLFFSWSILSREEPLCGHVIGLVFTHRLGLKAEADINYCVIIVRHCVSRIALLPSTQPFRTLSQLKVGLAALNLHPFASDSLVLDRRPTRKRPFFHVLSKYKFQPPRLQFSLLKLTRKNGGSVCVTKTIT